MKTLFTTFFLCSFFLFAQEQEPSRSLWDYHPLHLGGNSLYIGDAEVSVRQNGKDKKDGHLHFNKSNAFWYMLLPVSETTFFFPRVEWTTFELDWTKNTKFDEKRFYYLQFGMTMYSIAIEKWRWITRIDYNIDANHFSKAKPYGLWTWLLWGAYKLHDKWNYHVGTVGYIGMKGHDVFPILGVDFSPNKTWNFQAIFPISYAIQYQALDWCKIAIKGRPLRERFRVGAKDKEPSSIFHYTSMGTELNLTFEKKMRFETEFFVGYNFGGTFYIKNQHGKKPLHTDVKSAPYLGANIDYAF